MFVAILFLVTLKEHLLLYLLLQVHDYKEGTPEEKTYYIELWDVGGSVGSASSVKSTRAVFYNSVNGKVSKSLTSYQQEWNIAIAR